MIYAKIKNVDLKFETDKTLFSPLSIDQGTLAMLSVVNFSLNDKVLDLGCGYGVVGILAGKLIGQENIIMCDISEIAVKCSIINAKINDLPNLDVRISDKYGNIPENDFTIILSNPPYHTDFSVAKAFIETGFKKLVVSGKMVMVTKRLDWYKNKLTTIFGGVKVQQIGDYYVFVSEKRNSVIKHKEKNKNKLSKKLQRKREK